MSKLIQHLQSPLWRRSAIRLLGHLSPYAVYEAVIGELNGECGFAFVRDGVPTVIAQKNEGGFLCAVLGGRP